MMNEKFTKTLGWLITLLIPLVVLMISIRLLITPVFAFVEYRMPNFPEDPFGFTLEDRLRWSKPSINYLVNSKGIDFLESLQFDNGAPIFNSLELSHMQDVKHVVSGMRIGLAAAMILLLGLRIGLRKTGNQKELDKAFQRGGWWGIGLIAAILIFVAVSFNHLFTWFHQIFFEDGTWRFYTSDTLIRLFPMRFWRDAFIAVGLCSLILNGIIIVAGRTASMRLNNRNA